MSTTSSPFARPSGRRPDELRPVRLTRRFTKHAEGSVLVEFGDTRVICTASVEERVPGFLKGKGEGWLTAEYGMLPRAMNTRSDREAARGMQSGRTHEIKRLMDVGVFAAKGIRTPNLDRLAGQGRVFRNFHVAQAVCSASRCGLLTGCYPNRLGIHGALGPRSRVGINSQEMTLAELVKQRGYATSIFGKWHLGDAPEFLPLRHGFDEYYGLPYSNDMWPLHPEYVNLPTESARRKQGYPDLPMIEGDKVAIPKVTREDQNMLTTWYTERAVSFIERNKTRPFLLYLAHNMPHVPLHVSDKFRGKSARGLYGDVIEEIDWSVGQVLATTSRR